MTKAWHFLGDDGLMLDGRPAPADGEWLEHKGPIQICSSGLHASTRLIDALRYAPGSLLCRVEVEGVEDRHDDKLVARRRKILWRIDSEPVLRDFARRCALDVVHLWDAPDVVVQYLKTGDESLRIAAWAAAGADPWTAAEAAAWDVARDKFNRRLTSMVVAAHKKEKNNDPS